DNFHAVSISEWEVNAAPIADVEDIEIALEVGDDVDLPAELAATYEDGTEGSVPVKWRSFPADATAAPGEFTVDGRALGFADDYVTAAVIVAEAHPDPGDPGDPDPTDPEDPGPTDPDPTDPPEPQEPEEPEPGEPSDPDGDGTGAGGGGDGNAAGGSDDGGRDYLPRTGPSTGRNGTRPALSGALVVPGKLRTRSERSSHYSGRD